MNRSSCSPVSTSRTPCGRFRMHTLLLTLVAATTCCLAQQQNGNTGELVRIVAYKFNERGHRVVYVEQRFQNEEPLAKFLYDPIYHPVPEIQPVPAVPKPVHIVNVPAPVRTAPVVRPQPTIISVPGYPTPAPRPTPNIVQVPAMQNLRQKGTPVPHTIAIHTPAPAAAPVLVTHAPAVTVLGQPMQMAPQPMPVHVSQLGQYFYPAGPAPFLPMMHHGMMKRQSPFDIFNPITLPGTLLSPPVNCLRIPTLPSTAHLISPPESEMFACEILSPVLTGSFVVKNDGTELCLVNYDRVKFEGRHSFQTYCE